MSNSMAFDYLVVEPLWRISDAQTLLLKNAVRFQIELYVTTYTESTRTMQNASQAINYSVSRGRIRYLGEGKWVSF